MPPQEGGAPQIYISRNKHLPYIASYHGPWLSLPIDLLQSLLVLNAETAVPSSSPTASSLPQTTRSPSVPNGPSLQVNGDASTTAVVQKKRGAEAQPAPTKSPVSPAAPPLDPVIFKSLVAIRKLVDDASELVIKAAGGGGSSSNPLGISTSSGLLGGGSSGSRVSGLRQHRFRELAVQKLARAYRIDEVATSVLTMQGASALDDVASKVLKRSPQNLDALYVNFFHEKIPSRMLAASTTTETLDKIINQRPGVAEYHRTRAMVYGFREEFAASLKDFKAAILIAKKRRRLLPSPDCEKIPSDPAHRAHHQDKWEDLDECSEAQLYFLRAACYHQYAISILDRKIQEVNAKYKSEGGQQASAASLARGSAAFVSPDVLQAPLENYGPVLAPVADQVAGLARKSIRDYEKFLEFFPNPTFVEGGPVQVRGSGKKSDQQAQAQDDDDGDEGPMSPTVSAAAMEEFLQTVNLNPLLYGSAIKEPSAASLPKESNLSSASSLATLRNALKETDIQNAAKNLLALGTYHPLLVEAWYAIGINLMLLNDWSSAMTWHSRIIKLQDSVDGYPVFLPARSMSQADYVEVITRMKKTVPSNKLLTDGKAQPNMKRITTGVKGMDLEDGEQFDGGAATALVKHGDAINGTVGTGKAGAAAGSTTEKSSLRQYPLHTKRADNLVVFLQSTK